MISPRAETVTNGMTKPLIYWFRQDLRTRDLPGLHAAAQTGKPVIPIFVLDDEAAGSWRAGGASRWWLHHSLQALDSELRDLGGRLHTYKGSTVDTLEALVKDSGADAIYCSQQFEPWSRTLEQNVHEHFSAKGLTVKRFPGTLLHQPESISTQAGQPFKVYTPFWRACNAARPPAAPLPQPEGAIWFSDALTSAPLSELALLPKSPDWAADWHDYWTPGEIGANERAHLFLAGPAEHYDEGRDYAAKAYTSKLSAHLHHGEISVRTIWHMAEAQKDETPQAAASIEKFQSELGWREFCYHLLVHFPDIPEKPFKAPFASFPWASNETALNAWQRGQTGYPIVDAGMRELWQTGFMHNRVRMVVASFLTKHLLLHWRDGEDWFWDTLVDADLASNACSWQWVCGSGSDAAPYFRIFNPIAQGEKFDKEGEYVRRWVPEIAALPDKYLHKPWETPPLLLQEAGITLGETYPLPIVDHKIARESALAAYATIKGQPSGS